MSIRVLVNGAKGRMGRESVGAIQGDPDLELVGQSDLGDDLPAVIASSGAEVVVDFTQPHVAAENTETILRAGARPVVGTTGFKPEDIARLQAVAEELGLGGVIAPNFAIGAILLMEFAARAAKFFPDVEVIELHHEQKLDAPSGTAVKTVELIRKALDEAGVRPTQRPDETETVPGARGGRLHDIPVHSVRLPGFVAHQEVIFGGPGQILTLRHDAPLRLSFMPGVVLSCKKAPQLDKLYYGLDQIL